MRKIEKLWNICRLEMLIARSYLYIWIARAKYEQIKAWSRWYLSVSWADFRRTRHYVGLYRREFIDTKHIVFDGHRLKTTANIFCGLIAVAWLCEKMKVNLKIEGLSDFFENDVIINNPAEYRADNFNNTKVFFAGAAKMLWMGAVYVRSEYGYKITQKMRMKRELERCADEWFDNHIKGNWEAVHYRGTDTKKKFKYRYIKINDYITYLKEALDGKNSIFACSDQVQFIDRMHIAFPDKIFARDIQRSYNDRLLHTDPEYIGIQQKKDALIDMLVLAKADLVYATGSGFIDTLRFLNPSIKIVSLDGRWLVKRFCIGRSPENGASIPKEDLFKHLVKQYRETGYF